MLQQHGQQDVLLLQAWPHLNERYINAKAVSSVPPRTIGVLVLCLVAEKNGRKRPMHNGSFGRETTDTTRKREQIIIRVTVVLPRNI